MSSSRRATRAAVAPIYRRLPHGPHGKSREYIIRNQRARMVGAMIEAVAAGGYEQTSVKKVVAMAAVSRRSFYELFSSKEDCFLATFDAIVRQCIDAVRDACGSSAARPEDCLLVIFDALLDFSKANPKAAHLIVRDSPTAGEAGVQRLQKLLGNCEQVLGGYLTNCSGQQRPPVPLLRGVLGGLHIIIACGLAERRGREVSAEDLVQWTMLCAEPDASELRSINRAAMDLKEDPLLREQVQEEIAEAEDERTRMLFGALYLARSNGYSELNAIQIAEFAGLSMDEFFPLFASTSECYEEALGMLAKELLRVVCEATRETQDWPAAVRCSLAALTSHIARHPVHAQALNLALGSEQSSTVDRGLGVACQIASLLTERAPTQARESHRVELIAGAIAHTISSYVDRRASNLLPALVDYLSYLVIAPYLGSQEALGAILELRGQDTLMAATVD